MEYIFTLSKMRTEFNSPIQYFLDFETNFINVNQIINQQITISHIGYKCMGCNTEKKIYRQGFCYNCFYSHPAAADWIMHPELSKAHLGIEDRDLKYESEMQLQPHIVYLAVASDLKVGVTRKTQIPYRWIDQGASFAIAIVEVPNRYLAGITEVALKNFYTDKTNWRKMLQNNTLSINLIEAKQNIKKQLPPEVIPYFINDDNSLLEMVYPVEIYPTSISSLNLEKTPIFQGKLKGIKGQYLIFEDGTVFNIRAHEGYIVKLTIT